MEAARAIDMWGPLDIREDEAVQEVRCNFALRI